MLYFVQLRIAKVNPILLLSTCSTYHQTGEKISEHNAKEREKESAYNSAYFVLNDDRVNLYERINKRVDAMFEEGLVEEVTALQERGYTRGMVSMQGLGYKEIFAYLDGECTLEEAKEIIKRDTRHFAKRQITWFKRERDVIWINKQEYGYRRKRHSKYETPLCNLDILKEPDRTYWCGIWSGDQPLLCNEGESISDRIYGSVVRPNRGLYCMGEFRICRKLQVPPEKLFISGVMKKRDDIREILAYCGNRCAYTVQSPLHCLYLWNGARNMRRIQISDCIRDLQVEISSEWTKIRY